MHFFGVIVQRKGLNKPDGPVNQVGAVIIYEVQSTKCEVRSNLSNSVECTSYSVHDLHCGLPRYATLDEDQWQVTPVVSAIFPNRLDVDERRRDRQLDLLNSSAVLPIPYNHRPRPDGRLYPFTLYFFNTSLSCGSSSVTLPPQLLSRNLTKHLHHGQGWQLD